MNKDRVSRTVSYRAGETLYQGKGEGSSRDEATKKALAELRSVLPAGMSVVVCIRKAGEDPNRTCELWTRV